MGALTSQAASSLVGNLVVTQFNGGVGASASTFWRGDMTWASPFGSPIASLQISANAVAQTPPANSLLTLTGNDATALSVDMFGFGIGPKIISNFARGTKAAPTAAQNGNTLFSLLAQAYDGAAYQSPGGLRVIATETWSGTQRGMSYFLAGTPSGSVTSATWLSFNNANNGLAEINLPISSPSDATINGLTVGKGQNSKSQNTTFGLGANGLTNAVQNTAFGYHALNVNTLLTGNAAFGASALALLDGAATPGNNSGFGQEAGSTITAGLDNTCLGSTTGYGNATGSQNTWVGSTAGGALGATGNNSNNCGVGFRAGARITTGGQNCFFGPLSGQSVTTGAANVIMGGYAGTAGMNNNIILSDGAGNVYLQFDGTNWLFTGKWRPAAATPNAYVSSDNSAGISTTITTALLVGKTITVKDGIITAFA